MVKYKGSTIDNSDYSPHPGAPLKVKELSKDLVPFSKIGNRNPN